VAAEAHAEITSFRQDGFALGWAWFSETTRRRFGSSHLLFVVVFVFLISISVLLVLCSLLTWVQVRGSMWAWKFTILAGEFGHWFALGTGAVIVAAAGWLNGFERGVVIALGGLAIAGFLRPVWLARRIARELPQTIQAALGGSKPEGVPFDLGWLLRGTPAESELVTTEVFSRVGGMELKLDFYQRGNPRPVAKKPRVCIVVIHGGGWDSGDRTQLSAWNRRWVARGYVVAAITYRLAPQFTWPAQGDDVKAAVAWLKEHAERLGIDAQRLVILGRSAGGQLATAVGYGLRDPAIRGVIALYAPHDLPFAWSVSSEHDALNSVNLFRQYFGGGPDTPERVARYEEASGQLLAREDSPPTLLVHGVPDTLAWVRHSERLAARLSELGVKHYFLRLPWATHGFDFNPNGPAGQLTDFAIDYFIKQVTRDPRR
jgi:acetyl esterase/lipase